MSGGAEWKVRYATASSGSERRPTRTTLAQAVRSLSHELHPTVLQHAGLVATLRQHCADVGQHHRLKAMFSADDALESLALMWHSAYSVSRRRR